MSTDFDAVCDTCKQVIHAGQISAGRHTLAYGFDDHLGCQALATWLFKHAEHGMGPRIEIMDAGPTDRISDGYTRLEL